jgi:hypothetical protein
MIQAIVMDIGGVVAPDIWEWLYFSEYRLSSLSHLSRSTLLRVGRMNFSLFAYRKWNRSSSWQALEEAYWTAVSDDLGIKLDGTEIADKTSAITLPFLDLSKIKEFSAASGLRVVFCSNDTPFWYFRKWNALNWGNSYSSDAFIMSFDFGQSKRDPRCVLFIALAPNGLRCDVCGKDGCWKSHVGGDSRRLKLLSKLSGSSETGFDFLNDMELFNMLSASQKEAYVDDLGRAIVLGLTSIIDANSIERIYLTGGGISYSRGIAPAVLRFLSEGFGKLDARDNLAVVEGDEIAGCRGVSRWAAKQVREQVW